jgi:hypothetical protein
MSPSRCTQAFACECHRNMGNDYYFLPHDRCLRRDGICTNVDSQWMEADNLHATIEAIYEGWPFRYLPRGHIGNIARDMYGD